MDWRCCFMVCVFSFGFSAAGSVRQKGVGFLLGAEALGLGVPVGGGPAALPAAGGGIQRPAASTDAGGAHRRLVSIGGILCPGPHLGGVAAAVAGDDDVAAFAAAVTARVAGDQQATWTVACPWGAEIRVTSAAAAGRDIFAPHHPFAREAA